MKPLLVYDGTCGFCKRWIERWRVRVGDRAEFAPSQEVGARFPAIPAEAFAEAVHLIEEDGRVSRGAEAVFRLLAIGGSPLGLRAYRGVPGFCGASEACYRIVAGHRPFFDRATTWLWGRHVVPPPMAFTLALYLRLLGVIFAIAFASLAAQLPGLVGSRGILPVRDTLHAVTSVPSLAAVRYGVLPTLCWISPSDAFLMGQALAGVACAVLVALGILTVPSLLACWALYLSLASVCREFLWFQWDGLILESAILGLFLVPGEAGRGGVRSARWLLFRLLVASAVVKLSSGDPAWRDLTALRYHYETQPLPTPIAWYVDQLPLGFHRLSAAVTFLVEGLVPFLIFAPRRARFLAAGLIAGHQILIALTGNYGFFNLLTIALCVPLLDDAVWPKRWAEGRVRAAKPWPAWVRGPVLIGIFLLSLVPFLGSFARGVGVLGPLPRLYEWAAPFRTVNSYGLFAIMTKERPEIRIEGSRDGVDWKAYEFRFKPGDPMRAPGFVTPHMPRLDWQMWFAALSDYRGEGWLLQFCQRLLEGSRPVLALMSKNPFPDGPPRYVRAVVERYSFTDPATRRATGAWWTRGPRGLYAPVLTLDHGTLAAAPPELQRP